MSDIFKDMQANVGCEYISDLPSYKRKVWHEMKRLKSMIDVARQKLMNDPTFKHLSEDCQEYYFDFEAYASHLQERGKFLVTEHGIFELPE